MTITNGYATVAQFQRFKGITNADALDDAEIEAMIEEASRMIDAVCSRWFYAYSQTRYYDVPEGRELFLEGDDLLTVTTLTNGDTTVLTTADYYLLPRNDSPKYAVVLKESSTYLWEEDSSGNAEGAITIAGTWGFVSRAAADPQSARVIDNTRRACLMICKQWMEERFGVNVGGNVYITAGGVVQSPAGAIPKAAYDMIKPYIRIV